MIAGTGQPPQRGAGRRTLHHADRSLDRRGRLGRAHKHGSATGQGVGNILLAAGQDHKDIARLHPPGMNAQIGPTRAQEAQNPR